VAFQKNTLKVSGDTAENALNSRGGISGKSLECNPRYIREGTLFFK
jgi:hypothetical protein